MVATDVVRRRFPIGSLLPTGVGGRRNQRSSATAAIRRAAEDSYTYLVLLTSFGSQDDVLAGMEAGGDDYVTKQLDPFTLRTRLLVARRVTSLHAQLGKYRQELTRQARTDPLTNLDNRLKLTEDLELLHGRSQRYGSRYSLALCDVDHFKSFNDLQGHPVGDEALKAVARNLVLLLRDTDGVYRYGGEEFLLILPDQGALDAEAAVERIRSGIEPLAITLWEPAPGVDDQRRHLDLLRRPPGR